jgi:hypothetical protein
LAELAKKGSIVQRRVFQLCSWNRFIPNTEWLSVHLHHEAKANLHGGVDVSVDRFAMLWTHRDSEGVSRLLGVQQWPSALPTTFGRAKLANADDWQPLCELSLELQVGPLGAASTD